MIEDKTFSDLEVEISGAVSEIEMLKSEFPHLEWCGDESEGGIYVHLHLYEFNKFIKYVINKTVLDWNLTGYCDVLKNFGKLPQAPNELEIEKVKELIEQNKKKVGL